MELYRLPLGANKLGGKLGKYFNVTIFSERAKVSCSIQNIGLETSMELYRSDRFVLLKIFIYNSSK